MRETQRRDPFQGLCKRVRRWGCSVYDCLLEFFADGEQFIPVVGRQTIEPASDYRLRCRGHDGGECEFWHGVEYSRFSYRRLSPKSSTRNPIRKYLQASLTRITGRLYFTNCQWLMNQTTGANILCWKRYPQMFIASCRFLHPQGFPVTACTRSLVMPKNESNRSVMSPIAIIIRIRKKHQYWRLGQCHCMSGYQLGGLQRLGSLQVLQFFVNTLHR